MDLAVERASVEFKAIVAPLLQRLPGTEEQKLAAVAAGGAALSVAALCCVCGSTSRAAPATTASAEGMGTASDAPAAAETVAKPDTADEARLAKERKRPAPLDTGGTPAVSASPRGQLSAEAVAEMLGRRQQVLDEIVAVDEECVSQLHALDKHFVGEDTRAPLARTIR
jgi:hypothetical protein